MSNFLEKYTKKYPDMCSDARALQERDEFFGRGWLKLVAPAKVNLCLAIETKSDKSSGEYHNAHTVLHALNIHDVIYMRYKTPDDPDFGSGKPRVRMLSAGDVDVPVISSDDNLVTKALMALAQALEESLQGAMNETVKSELASLADLEVRVEKHIPFQAGLGGASSDAAAALVGMRQLLCAANLEASGCPSGSGGQGIQGIPGGSESSRGLEAFVSACTPQLLERVASTLGADVPFFLHGGCAYLDGYGEHFVRALEPSHDAIAIVKPQGGVSTAQAYACFDAETSPLLFTKEMRESLLCAQKASEVQLFNNLEAAAEYLMPELLQVKEMLVSAVGKNNTLLCGSGAAFFARCESFSEACALVAQARGCGLWARASSLGSMRADCFKSKGV